MCKKILIFLLVLIIVCANAYAHSGGTDWSGGHTDHSTGEYHYHHGKPAHQHPNGICPYDEGESDNYYILPDDENEFEEDITDIVEYDEEDNEDEKEETEEINGYIRIYTAIGVIVMLINLWTDFKEFIRDEFGRKKFQGLLFLLLLISAISFCCWMLYMFSFYISKSLFKEDIVLTHICANIPTFYTIYCIVRNHEEGKQS